MMKTIVLAIIGSTMICSCVSRVGLVYADVNMPESVSSAGGLKTGKSESRSYFGLVGVGDCSLETAKRNGGITTVSTCDTKVENVLGVVKFTTTVTGH